MAKKAIKKKTTKRPKHYEPKVKFDGSFKELIDISIRDADKKKAKKEWLF